MVQKSKIENRKSKVAEYSKILADLPSEQIFTEIRACLHEGGGPQVGEVTRLGGVTRLSRQSLILI